MIRQNDGRTKGINMHTMTIEQYVRQVTGIRFGRIPLDGMSRSFRGIDKEAWYVMGFDDVRVLWNQRSAHILIACELKIIDMEKSESAAGDVASLLLMLANGPAKDVGRAERMRCKYLPAAMEAATCSGLISAQAAYE